MGLLGTVLSLLPMVNSMGDLGAQTGSFFLALTSTFWGIVFAIIFKAINGVVEAEIDYCNKLTDLYFSRNSVLFKRGKVEEGAALKQKDHMPANKTDKPDFTGISDTSSEDLY